MSDHPDHVDIVQRLREAVFRPPEPKEAALLVNEAAETIELLRKLVGVRDEIEEEDEDEDDEPGPVAA